MAVHNLQHLRDVWLYEALQPLQATSASGREFASLALKGLTSSLLKSNTLTLKVPNDGHARHENMSKSETSE